MEKLRLNIDGREVTGYKGQTILEVALENNISIPTFCYDKRMDTYGSCGICVVEAENTPKLLRSCSTEILDGMVVRTDTPRVRESRKMNLELLLSQHTGDCRAPCVMACPAQTDCQGYTGLIANGEFDEAIKLIKTKIPLAASIGRVCPHPCEDACRRNLVDEPVSILNLKRFAADIDLNKPEPYLPEVAPSTGKTVAVIGGGPGGLSCAYFLAQLGHSVTIFDAMPKMGGMLRYGIPEYRLPKSIVDKETELIGKLGVKFINNVKIGADTTLESLRATHDAVVAAIGAWTSMGLRCKGSDMRGVYGGIDFLRSVVQGEPISVGKRVAVVGGGNTAMDACRTAVRLGAQTVYNIYRRTKAEMPAEEIEITEAEEEGVIFKYLVNPAEVLGENNTVTGLRLQRMRLGEPDASGRRAPEPIQDDFEVLEVDTVIAALGQGINPDGFTGLELTKGNTIVADENMFTTNKSGIFAIGDCVNRGASIAIAAIGDAKKAAAAIHDFLSGAPLTRHMPYRVTRNDLTPEDFADRKKEPRSRLEHLKPETRRDNFLQYTETFCEADAVRDAARCLECGCHDFFECKLIDLAAQYKAEPDRLKESVTRIKYTDKHPFISRDPNKCILCGLCVRMCDEIVGSTALGIVNRGFDSVVKPAFEDPLCDTTCISCGQCVSVCPTGALTERQAFKKPVPLDTAKTDSVCGMCAAGCSARIESIGNLLVKTTPAQDRGINGGVMCGRGRFGISYVQREGRITQPMIRRDGKLVPAAWYDAFVYAAKKLESLRMREEKLTVSIGQSYCLEDAGAIINLAKLFDAELLSFGGRENGLRRVLGIDASPNALEEILGCDAAVVVGDSLISNPVILSKLRLAAKKGTEITVVTQGEGYFNLPCTVIKAENSTRFIKQITKALIDAGCKAENAAGLNELSASLSDVSVSDGAQAFADSYKAAKKAMILYSINDITPEAAAELANMAVVSGHIGSPRDGIYMLRQMAGSQALADLGVCGSPDCVAGSGGLMIFGEDCDIDTDNLSFLFVQDTHMTKTAQKADVVFPLTAYPERNGTFISTERRVQRCVSAVKAPFEYDTAQIAQEIASVFEKSAPPAALHELYPDAEYGACYPAPVLLTDGFGFSDKLARLSVIPDSALFDSLEPTSSLMRAVIEDLPNPRRN